jgi:DNA sulfur modification protein DndD
MKITLLGWKCAGLRCPDLELDFSFSGHTPHHVSLLQMPNGTGKTTTLLLLEASLTGSASQWSPSFVKDLRRPGDDAAHGTFICKLGVDERPLTIEMTLHFEEGKVLYQTTFGSRQENKWDPPAETRMFLNDKFVKLFIFDGEYAHRLLLPGKAEAGNAVDALFQLHLFGEMAERAQEDWKLKSKNATAKTTVGLENKRKMVASLESRKAQISSKRKDAARKLEELTALTSELKLKIGTRMDRKTGLRDELRENQRAQENAKAEVETASRAALDIIRNPHRAVPAFSSALRDLYHQLDVLKLPASTAAQWFDELAAPDNDLCVCGRTLGESERAAILERKGDVLGSEVYGVLNAVKADVQGKIITSHFDTTSLEDANKSIGAATKTRKIADTEIRNLELLLVQEGDDQLESLIKTRNDYEGKIGSCTKILQWIDAPANHEGAKTKPTLNEIDQLMSLAEIEKHLKQEEIELAKATETLSLRKSTEILKAILEDTHRIANKHLRESVRTECNEHLETILQNDPLRIGSIERHLSLEGQAGASMGQTLAVGYTFLATLLNRGQHSFPLIVDSPAGPLDGKVRTRVGGLIPALCDQFIAFTISTEREWFVSAIDEAAESKVQYLTVFRKTQGTAHLMDGLKSTAHVETENGVLVEGIEFFNNFDMEEES